jgi:hypothetical protein
VGFWRRFRWLLGALRLLIKPLPHQRVCARPSPSLPPHPWRPPLPVPLLCLLVQLLPLLVFDPLPCLRVCVASMLPTPLRFGRRLLRFGRRLSDGSAGAGRTGGANGKDGAWPVVAVEEDAVSVDLKAHQIVPVPIGSPARSKPKGSTLRT